MIPCLRFLFSLTLNREWASWSIFQNEYMSMNIYIYFHMYVCMCTPAHARARIHTHMYMYVYVYRCIYVYRCASTHTHTITHILGAYEGKGRCRRDLNKSLIITLSDFTSWDAGQSSFFFSFGWVSRPWSFM